jgi:hypothetical protein
MSGHEKRNARNERRWENGKVGRAGGKRVKLDVRMRIWSIFAKKGISACPIASFWQDHTTWSEVTA